MNDSVDSELSILSHLFDFSWLLVCIWLKTHRAMSLFKVRDWWSTKVGVEEEFDQGCLCVANVNNNAEKQGKENCHLSIYLSVYLSSYVCIG